MATNFVFAVNLSVYVRFRRFLAQNFPLTEFIKKKSFFKMAEIFKIATVILLFMEANPIFSCSYFQSIANDSSTEKITTRSRSRWWRIRSIFALVFKRRRNNNSFNR
jgi:hypothetical protein